jgi:hypothetical protein
MSAEAVRTIHPMGEKYPAVMALRNDILAEVEKLGKKALVSRKLIDRFDLIADRNAPEAQQCESHVRLRLKRLERARGRREFQRNTCRDLEIVIVFGLGKIDTHYRKDALAILQLYGSQKSVKRVCAVFPGLSCLST